VVRPDITFLAAAHVGGIDGNRKDHTRFFIDNMRIQLEVLSAAAAFHSRLVFLGSSCIYPRNAEQPIQPASLLTGPLEKTNEGYALAKICGVKLCEWFRAEQSADFISIMPCNLYGPGDNYNNTGHVIPMLIRRFVEAKRDGIPVVKVWGTGNAVREFLYSDDAADGLIFFAKLYGRPGNQEKGYVEPINLGSGGEITIRTLAHRIAEMTGYRGLIEFDPGMPDGTPHKVMDSRRASIAGWYPRVSLQEGLQRTVADYYGRNQA
jgi:GDP-L-fucose synthase